MNFKKSFFYVFVPMMLLQATCDATSPKGMVNILSWSNYMSLPRVISMVKSGCGVEISSDEYYYPNDCLKRISTLGDFYDYDIVIFQSNIYELIEKKIKLKNKSSLSEVVKEYSSVIRDHYLSRNYPDNIVYFTLFVTGFIWNPDIIKLSASDSNWSMFKKAKNNIVILSESRTAIWSLINSDQKAPLNLLADVFGKVIQNADIYVVDGSSKLYDKSSFAFALQRSSEAVEIIEASKNKALTFFIHPKYSFISPDLIAELNARPETRCVARVLASKKVLDIVQEEKHYLSPYGTYASVSDPIFRNVYKSLFDNIHAIRWVDSCYAKTIKEYLEIRNKWNKIYLLPQVMENHSLKLKSKLGVQ